MAAEASLTRYFKSVSLNKIKEVRLREQEDRIDDERRRVMSKFWKDKYDILDDLVQINVKTPTYNKFSGSSMSADKKDGHNIQLGNMNFDGKLLTGVPLTLKKKKQDHELRVEPVICVIGTEAICYPNSESKRGRRIKLDTRTTRTLEAAKAHEQTLETLSKQKYTRVQEKPNPFHIRNSQKYVCLNGRPFTAPRPRRVKSPIRKIRRPGTVIGIHNE